MSEVHPENISPKAFHLVILQPMVHTGPYAGSSGTASTEK